RRGSLSAVPIFSRPRGRPAAGFRDGSFIGPALVRWKLMLALWKKTRLILDMIKFEHTIFALPFALISVLLASRRLPHGLPSSRTLAYILLAMVSARSAAMAFNRLADAEYDRQNPRT